MAIFIFEVVLADSPVGCLISVNSRFVLCNVHICKASNALYTLVKQKRKKFIVI